MKFPVGSPLRWSVLSLAACCAALGLAGWAVTQQPDEQGGAQPGVVPLAQGPVHEAFGEPVNFNPSAGLVVSKEPPEPVAELPPEEKPEGDSVTWIPGYWGYDESSQGYVWISGFWRVLPPGMRWLPGYWAQVQDGFQWVSGYWAPVEQTEVTYLPPPPESLEVGPSTEAPSDNQIWVPGCWIWRDTRYLWRPGYWLEGQTNWVWTPDHYVWTPAGCVFVAGYWDYALAQRGLLFAPVAFTQPLYTQANYFYTPSAVVNTTTLPDYLFACPGYSHYYFGNYYGNNYLQRGIYPWFAFHNSHYGYDPLFAHALWTHERQDRNWLTHLQEDYHVRVREPQARPERTFALQQSRFREGAGAGPGSRALVESLRQVASVAGTQQAAIPLRLGRIDRQQRQQIVEQTAGVRKAMGERVRLERQAEATSPLRQAKGEARPMRLQVPATPLASRPVHELKQSHVPPAPPRVAHAAPTAAPQARPAARPRPEELLKGPHPTFRPRAEAVRPVPQREVGSPRGPVRRPEVGPRPEAVRPAPTQPVPPHPAQRPEAVHPAPTPVPTAPRQETVRPAPAQPVPHPEATRPAPAPVHVAPRPATAPVHVAPRPEPPRPKEERR